MEGNVFSAASELLYQQFGDVILNSEVGVVVFHFYIFFAQKISNRVEPHVQISGNYAYLSFRHLFFLKEFGVWKSYGGFVGREVRAESEGYS